MKCCRDAAARAVDALARIEVAEDLWTTFAAVASDYGFDRVFAYRVDDQGRSAPKIVHATAPDGSLVPVEHRGVRGLIEQAALADRPFFAHERPQQRALVEYAREMGFDDALFLPIRNQGAFEGVVVLAGRQSALTPVVRSSLHVLGHLAFAGAVLATPRKSAGTLSAREAECLRLAAHGNTDAMIGRLLSISPRTARFHIENAKKKLGVTTRTQAVAEALRLNAIAA